MIFCFFLTAGHLPHSTLVADQKFLTAQAKNVYIIVEISRSEKCPIVGTPMFFSFFSWRERERDRRSQVSLSFVSLSSLCILPQQGEPLDRLPEDPMGQPQQDFFCFNQSQLVPTCRRKTPGIYYSRIPLVKEMSPLLVHHTCWVCLFFMPSSTGVGQAMNNCQCIYFQG